MPYPDLDYISMQEAANDPKFKISTERLRRYSEEGLLSIYIEAPLPERLSYTKENGPPHRYAKVIAPRWHGDILDFESSTAVILDETEKPLVPRQVKYAAGFSYSKILIKTIDLRKLNMLKTHQNTDTRSEQDQKKQVSAPDVTGRKGPIKTMILEGLQAFYDQKKRLPEAGNAFREFLDFIYIQFNQKPRPDYLAQIVKLEKTGTETSNCITIKGGKKPKNRKYISSQFYKFKNDFTPKVTAKEPAAP